MTQVESGGCGSKSTVLSLAPRALYDTVRDAQMYLLVDEV